MQPFLTLQCFQLDMRQDNKWFAGECFNFAISSRKEGRMRAVTGSPCLVPSSWSLVAALHFPFLQTRWQQRDASLCQFLKAFSKLRCKNVTLTASSVTETIVTSCGLESCLPQESQARAGSTLRLSQPHRWGVSF